MADDTTRPLIVVLTGGIASGKTTVSDLFREQGVPIVDADEIAHAVVRPGTVALDKIIDEFGNQILLESGALDRKKLRDIVFKNDTARKALEVIVHPEVSKEIHRSIAALRAAYCIVVIPLFVENESLHEIADRVLVVDVDEETQLARVMDRDRVSRNKAIAMIRAQATRQQRLERADDVIVNDRGPEDLRPQIEKLHASYLRTSDASRASP